MLPFGYPAEAFVTRLVSDNKPEFGKYCLTTRRDMMKEGSVNPSAISMPQKA